MSMMDAQRRITKKALFSVKRLGETVIYENRDGQKEIVAIVEIGPEMSRSDWNDAATKVEHASVNDIAEISVLRSDIEKPVEGDTITYNGEKWNVTQGYRFDSAGNSYVLICTKRGTVYGL